MTVSFGANINVTPYLNEGIVEACNVKNSYDVKLSDKTDFLQALNLIKKDKSIDTFEINRVPGSKIEMHSAAGAQITVDGKTEKCHYPFGNVNDAYQCIKNVINFAKNKYGDMMLNPLTDTAKQIENDNKKLSILIQNFIGEITGSTWNSRWDTHFDYVNRMASNGDYFTKQ